jgi:hypothetical protein
VGVLAAKFLQAPTPSNTDSVMENSNPDTLTVNQTIPTPTIVTVPAPIATPSSLLKVSWKTHSTSGYKITYPSTWTKKNSANGLVLTRKSKTGSAITEMSVSIPDKNVQGASCNAKSVFMIQKDQSVWDIQEISPTTYVVCESGNDFTAVGVIDLGSTSEIEKEFVDEFIYILQNVEINNKTTTPVATDSATPAS